MDGRDTGKTWEDQMHSGPLCSQVVKWSYSCEMLPVTSWSMLQVNPSFLSHTTFNKRPLEPKRKKTASNVKHGLNVM